ncbi:ACP S-malonyltransferase, partial [uncultured Legionella sp.]|uniref:ACP S-malonyltransferase n=1 Tax=uncultured Legionella sp. TaxID=210934 RepID=UPI002620EFC1
MTTFVFPGQGSQVKGMGASLFEEFSDLTQKADQILGYSIRTLCLEDPNNELGKTNFTQPALYTISAMSYLKKLSETGKVPASVAGHSLGEYNALFAAGVFDFETGLRLVQKRGALMSAATGGGMAAVVGLKSDDVRTILQQNNLNNIVIANYNSFTQVVISGAKEAILAAEPVFTNAGAMLYLPLNVSGAFHSPFMQGAQNEFAEFIKSFQFHAPQIE